MGTLLTGYGDEGDDHEGYAAQALSDSTLTSTCSNDTKSRRIRWVVTAGSGVLVGIIGFLTSTGLFDATARKLPVAAGDGAHTRPCPERSRVRNCQQRRPVLAGLTDSHHTTTGGGLFRGGRRDLLPRTLDRLARASELVGQLRAPREAP